MASVPFHRDTILTDLKDNVLKVQFIKSNNQTRILTCTLREDIIHRDGGTIDANYLQEQHAKPENKEVVVVWDMDNKGWRSFRMNSIQWVEMKDYMMYL